MEIAGANFFRIVFLFGVLLFYGATFLRALLIYLKTKHNPYDFEESKDKGFLLLILIAAINLFLPGYTKYFVNLGFLLGSFITAVKITASFLLLASILLLVYSQSSLGASWKIGLEKERKTKLIQTGMYKYCRHPIYFAMSLFYISLFFLLPSILLLVVLIGNILALVLTAQKEEKHLVEEFGDSYKNYIKKTGFIFPNPFLLAKKRKD